MRKILLLIVNTAFSQFQIGPKFGMNFSKNKAKSTGDISKILTDDFNKNVRTKTGINVGLMFNFGGDHVFNFQPEFMYVSKGFRTVDNNGNISYTQKNNYLDINWLFNLGKTVNNKWRVYGIFGPTTDIWLSKASYDKDGKFEDGSDNFKFDEVDDNISYTDIRFDIGFVLGAGFKYKLGPGWLIFSPRYKWGFIPQASAQFLTNESDYLYLKNKGFYLDFGYAFQFGGEKNE